MDEAALRMLVWLAVYASTSLIYSCAPGEKIVEIAAAGIGWSDQIGNRDSRGFDSLALAARLTLLANRAMFATATTDKLVEELQRCRAKPADNVYLSNAIAWASYVQLRNSQPEETEVGKWPFADEPAAFEPLHNLTNELIATPSQQRPRSIS